MNDSSGTTYCCKTIIKNQRELTRENDRHTGYPYAKFLIEVLANKKLDSWLRSRGSGKFSFRKLWS